MSVIPLNCLGVMNVSRFGASFQQYRPHESLFYFLFPLFLDLICEGRVSFVVVTVIFTPANDTPKDVYWHANHALLHFITGYVFHYETIVDPGPFSNYIALLVFKTTWY